MSEEEMEPLGTIDLSGLANFPSHWARGLPDAWDYFAIHNTNSIEWDLYAMRYVGIERTLVLTSLNEEENQRLRQSSCRIKSIFSILKYTDGNYDFASDCGSEVLKKQSETALRKFLKLERGTDSCCDADGARFTDPSEVYVAVHEDGGNSLLGGIYDDGRCPDDEMEVVKYFMISSTKTVNKISHAYRESKKKLEDALRGFTNHRSSDEKFKKSVRTHILNPGNDSLETRSMDSSARSNQDEKIRQAIRCINAECAAKPKKQGFLRDYLDLRFKKHQNPEQAMKVLTKKYSIARSTGYEWKKKFKENHLDLSSLFG